MERVRALFFDLDGTLLDSQHGIVKAFRLTFQELGMRPLPRDEEVARLIGPPFEVMLAALGYELSPGEMQRFVGVYRRLYWTIAPEMSPPFPGVIELLEELAAVRKEIPGFVVGVATNKRTEVAEHILQHLELTDYLDRVQGFDEDLRPKPAPDLLLRALERVGASPEETLLVGDTAADLLAAQAAGTRSCLAAYGYGTDEIPATLVPDLRIEHPMELMHWLRSHLAA